VTWSSGGARVSINQASGQTDPTNTSPINFTVVFGAAATGFATGDVTITGTAGGTKVATVTGSGTTYNVAVTGMTTAGTVLATVPAGVALIGTVSNPVSTSTDKTVEWTTGDVSTLTISSNLASTTYRQSVTLSAQFPAAAGAGRLVTFERMTPVAPGTWVSIGTATTNAAGLATLSYGPPYNTQFRAVFAEVTDLDAATSNTVKVSVRYKVSLKPGANATTVVRSGTRIKYTASASPKAPAGLQRVTFLIYKRINRAWVFQTSATVPTVAGVASFTRRWSRGEWYMRARGNATIYNVTVYSTLSKVTVR
jgi:hypothetical protein